MAFSVGIKDYNVVDRSNGRERVGAARNFCIVNDAGDLRKEWRGLDFTPNAIENRFLERRDLYERDSVDFEYFVQPDLRFSSMGLSGVSDHQMRFGLSGKCRNGSR